MSEVTVTSAIDTLFDLVAEIAHAETSPGPEGTASRLAELLPKLSASLGPARHVLEATLRNLDKGFEDYHQNASTEAFSKARDLLDGDVEPESQWW